MTERVGGIGEGAWIGEGNDILKLQIRKRVKFNFIIVNFRP